MIHKTHTKKDLIEIIQVFNFEDALPDYLELCKDDLVARLDLHLRTIYEIKPEKEYFDIEDIDDLRQYLKSQSPKQLLSIKVRDEMIDISKKLIFYCKICGYCLGLNTYQTIEEVIADAKKISMYGDIPTIRRALKLVNNDCKIQEEIKPIITYRIQQRLDRKDRLKQNSLAKMSVHRGEFIVKFS